MKMKEFVNGQKAIHRDHGTGVIKECNDADYVYFIADSDGFTHFACRGYLAPIKEKQ